MFAQAQETSQEVVPQATDSAFGLWQILALVGIVVILVGYKMWKNKTMS
ncbi:MAG: hypothetical protein H6818_19700 [Phycisphaerales bacterium]|nr:hypothetical protein [Phycisphaerales bacterium]MCB9863692.1 hypothetical protein [Phycisphaerales bacterium]